jgi:chromosome segregation ATPase
MAKIDDKWDRIFKKIQMILDKNAKLEEQILAFQQKINNLEQKIIEQNKEKENLNEQIKLVKTTKEVYLSENERAATKQKLKDFMTEIDDCLAKLVQ